MRIRALLILAGCTPAPPTPVPSERGPDMVHVDGDAVRLGWKKADPVPGFESPFPGMAGLPPPGTPRLPPPGAPGGPRFPPNPASSQGPPTPSTPGAPQGPFHSSPAPDLGLAPGAPSHGDTRPMPDPLDPVDVRVGDFYIDLTEVTQAQYALFLDDTGYRPPYVDEGWAEEGWDWNGSRPPAETASHPVVLVSWWDARAYCAWAGKRLPTEAEWQLAVLGPADDERTFPWGDTYDASKLNHGRMEEPNFDDADGWARTSPVGSFPEGASRYGLLDAFGNAWEWTADIRVRSWDEVSGERQDGVIVDPHTGTVGIYAAVRGSAYFFDIRPNPAAERNGFLVELRRKTSGFRCARDP